MGGGGGRGYGLTKCSNVPAPFLGKSERSWNLQLDYQKNDKNIKNLVALEVSKIIRHTQPCIHLRQEKCLECVWWMPENLCPRLDVLNVILKCKKKT